jgi:TonB family protein
MCPPPMSRTEPEPLHVIVPTRPDLNRILEQKVEAGFPPELALDLVLHDLVMRAVDSTGATSAALALVRGGEMVCRAATGLGAPDLGIPLNTRDGLSGACLRTHQPQLCADTDSDPRVDSVIARRLGIRSILIVPVLDEGNLIGVLEVFSSHPSAFSEREQSLLEGSAGECTRIRHTATDLGQSPARPLALGPSDEEQTPAETPLSRPLLDARKTQPPYDNWTLLLGTLAILAAVALSVMVGSRLRWLISSPHSAQVQVPRLVSSAPSPAALPTVPARIAASPARNTAPSAAPRASASPSADELVVYDHGKVIFRMKPATRKTSAASVPHASESAKMAPSSNIWLAPDEAETRLLSRVEPQYPRDALTTHLSGEVVLGVSVAEDGSVASIRILSGDPLLSVAATDAVRQWRYQPYVLHDHASQFQTEVTLKFSLPN